MRMTVDVSLDTPDDANRFAADGHRSGCVQGHVMDRLVGIGLRIRNPEIEGVRPGARVLVTRFGVVVPVVPQIQLFKLEHETDQGGDFNILATYKNVPAKFIFPTPPCTPFVYHVENGGIDSPKKADRLRPGATYRYRATLRIGGKFVSKGITFTIDTNCTFLYTLVIDFQQ